MLHGRTPFVPTFGSIEVEHITTTSRDEMTQQHHQHLKDHHLDAWLARSVVLVIAILQLAFVNDLSVGGAWLAPTIELALLVPLSIGTAWTHRTIRRAQSSNEWHLVRRPRRFVRRLATVLTAFSTSINLVALILLLKAIVQGYAGSGRALLVDAINIWTTNVVVFSLWYWILDRGGPSSRGMVDDDMRDFLFPQQQEASGAGGRFSSWLPGFVDYVFLAFTNATAFSPADTFPLSARAKLLMMAESTISLVTIALVASRAVGILM